jgi:hypothetical protein
MALFAIASTKLCPPPLVLYDSKTDGCVIMLGDDGLIELCCIVAVTIDKMVELLKLISRWLLRTTGFLSQNVW